MAALAAVCVRPRGCASLAPLAAAPLLGVSADAVDEKALAAGFLDLEQEMGIAIDYVKHDDAKAMAA